MDIVRAIPLECKPAAGVPASSPGLSIARQEIEIANCTYTVWRALKTAAELDGPVTDERAQVLAVIARTAVDVAMGGGR